MRIAAIVRPSSATHPARNTPNDARGSGAVTTSRAGFRGVDVTGAACGAEVDHEDTARAVAVGDALTCTLHFSGVPGLVVLVQLLEVEPMRTAGLTAVRSHPPFPLPL